MSITGMGRLFYARNWTYFAMNSNFLRRHWFLQSVGTFTGIWRIGDSHSLKNSISFENFQLIRITFALNNKFSTESNALSNLACLIISHCLPSSRTCFGFFPLSAFLWQLWMPPKLAAIPLAQKNEKNVCRQKGPKWKRQPRFAQARRISPAGLNAWSIASSATVEWHPSRYRQIHHHITPSPS